MQRTLTVLVAILAAVPVGATASSPTDGGSARLSFSITRAPETIDLAHSAGETSIGWDPARRAALIQLQTETVRVGWDPEGRANWTDASGRTTSHVTLDPILWTDERTGRTFVAQDVGGAGIVEHTDTAGDSWKETLPPSAAPNFDHETVGGGPYSNARLPPAIERRYPDAIYYCAQSPFQGCARSDDGGLLWGPPVSFNVNDCPAGVGHLQVSRQGTVLLPRGACDKLTGLLVSRDNGLQWSSVDINGTTPEHGDPAVAVDDGGTIYFIGAANGVPVVAVSTDDAATFSEPRRVDGAYAIANSELLMATAGDAGRAAVAFYGSPTPGNDQDASFPGVWHLYVSITTDGGATWTVTDATPNDPVQRGWICAGGLTCTSGRNLLDFQGMTLDDEGRVLVSYADGCTTDACISGASSDSTDSLATIARQETGPRLRAAFDPSPAPLGATIEAPSTARARDPVHFAGIAWGGTPPYAYAWDAGDGGTGSAPGLDATFPSAGERTVVLRVMDATGASVAASATIEISAAPTVTNGSDAVERTVMRDGFDTLACNDDKGWTTTNEGGGTEWQLAAPGANGTSCAWSTAEAGVVEDPGAIDTLESPAAACFTIPSNATGAALLFEASGEGRDPEGLAVETRPCGAGAWSTRATFAGALGDGTLASTTTSTLRADLSSLAGQPPFQIRFRANLRCLGQTTCSGFKIDSLELREAFPRPAAPALATIAAWTFGDASACDTLGWTSHGQLDGVPTDQVEWQLFATGAAGADACAWAPDTALAGGFTFDGLPPGATVDLVAPPEACIELPATMTSAQAQVDTTNLADFDFGLRAMPCAGGDAAALDRVRVDGATESFDLTPWIGTPFRLVARWDTQSTLFLIPDATIANVRVLAG